MSKPQTSHITTPHGAQVEINLPSATPEHIMRAIEAGCIIALLLAFTIVAICADFGPITDRLADALFYVERV